MPPFEMFTKDFAKEIFCGSKRLIKLKDVKMVEVTKFDELSVKTSLESFKAYKAFLILCHQHFQKEEHVTVSICLILETLYILRLFKNWLITH